MCISPHLRSFLADIEGKEVKTDTFPIDCPRKCPEAKQIIKFFFLFLQENMTAAVDAETQQPIEEENFPKAFAAFSELDKIIHDNNLDMDDKVDLIGLPSKKVIRRFVGDFFKMSQLHPETMIIALLILNRFLEATNWSLRSTIWRPLVITSVRLAQKLNNQAPLDSYSLHHMYPLLKPQEFAKLEVILLERVNYRVFFSPSEVFSQLEIIMDQVY